MITTHSIFLHKSWHLQQQNGFQKLDKFKYLPLCALSGKRYYICQDIWSIYSNYRTTDVFINSNTTSTFASVETNTINAFPKPANTNTTDASTNTITASTNIIFFNIKDELPENFYENQKIGENESYI